MHLIPLSHFPLPKRERYSPRSLRMPSWFVSLRFGVGWGGVGWGGEWCFFLYKISLEGFKVCVGRGEGTREETI